MTALDRPTRPRPTVYLPFLFCLATNLQATMAKTKSSSSSSTGSGPTGTLIGPPAKAWRVGRELGRGACGSVHEIARDASASSSSGKSGFVVKIAALPPAASATAARSKKRKKTPQERNADLLYQENVYYRNVLNDLRGTVVPEVPHPGEGGPPGYGDIDGYRYLCMERMDGPLTDVVPLLVASAKKKKSATTTTGSSTGVIDIGPIATTLISHMEAFHAMRLLFVDVKADNFMLAPEPSAASGGKKKGRKSTSSSSASQLLADRIRLIDFGLVEKYRDLSRGGHREDAHPDAQFVGTPEYASINVLSGHTPSRRDDLEAVGYVLADLLIRAVRYGTGTKSGSSTGSKKQQQMDIFPWSSCQSDEDVLDLKLAEVEECLRGGGGGKKPSSSAKGRAGKNGKPSKSSGTFFASLGAGGNGDAEGAMMEYFSAVRDLEYSEKPDYDELRDIVSDLSVKIAVGGTTGTASSTTRKRATTAKARATRSTARGRAKKVESDSEDDDSVQFVEEGDAGDFSPSPPKKRKGRTTAASRRAAAAAAAAADIDDEDSDVIMVDASDDDEDDYHTAMDWESVRSDENKPARSAKAAAAAEESSDDEEDEGSLLQIVVVEGPMKGHSFGLGGASADTVTIGSKPAKRGGGGVFKLTKDKQVAASHVKLAIFSAKGGSHSVRVTDLKAEGGTEVNGKEIPAGKYKQAFIGSKIAVGGSVLQIKAAA